MQAEVDAILRRFFTARIGMRFLSQHHIESFRRVDKLDRWVMRSLVGRWVLESELYAPVDSKRT